MADPYKGPEGTYKVLVVDDEEVIRLLIHDALSNDFSIAMVESACMMLDHLGENELSGRIRSAIGRVVSHGEARTYDMMKLQGRPDVLESGAASTVEMADAIIAGL